MRVALAALCVLFAVPSLAAPKQADPNQVAVELAKTTLSPEQWAATKAAIMSQVGAGGDLTAEQQADVKQAVDEMLPYQEMCDFLAGVLVKYYSVDEMRQLAAFYRSPLGKKALQIQPDLSRDTMAFVQTKLSRELPAVMQRLEAKHRAAQGAK